MLNSFEFYKISTLTTTSRVPSSLCSLGRLLWQRVPENRGKGEQMIKWMSYFSRKTFDNLDK